LLLLTVLGLPLTLIVVVSALLTHQTIESALLHPASMTAFEVVARAVAIFMAVGIVDCTHRIWSRLENAQVGALAGLCVVGVVPWAYYGKVGNVDVPSVFWVCLALEQVLHLSFAPGDAPRTERRALVLATMAVLTKDQVAGALLVPIAWMVLAQPFGVFRVSLWKSVALCFGLYIVISGALVNPAGWLARMRFIFGPASQDWAAYERSLGGRIAMMRDIVNRIPELTSWPSAALAIVGIGTCMVNRRRRRHLLPLASAVSFTATFNVLALRSEHRFLLVQTVLLAPYAALVPSLAYGSNRARVVGYAAFFVGWLASLRNVACLDATLVVDSRYGAEHFLATLPEHARVEILGGAKFFPRFPRHLQLARVGLDAPQTRSGIPGVREELGDPRMLDVRRPDYVVLSAEFATPEFLFSTEHRGPPVDSRTVEFVHGLEDGRLGYALAYRSACSLSWPLRCIRLHSCTGGSIAIFKSSGATAVRP
jgi:hypothetical protein